MSTKEATPPQRSQCVQIKPETLTLSVLSVFCSHVICVSNSEKSRKRTDKSRASSFILHMHQEFHLNEDTNTHEASCSSSQDQHELLLQRHDCVLSDACGADRCSSVREGEGESERRERDERITSTLYADAADAVVAPAGTPWQQMSRGGG